MPVAIDFIILALIYAFSFYKNWKAQGRDKLVVNTLMYIYLAFVLYFTLMPIVTSLPFIFDHPYVPMNLTPYIDVSYERGDFMQQIILNIIIMIPFGFLFPLVSSKRHVFLKTILYAFLLTLGIELIQPLIDSSRSSDITDIIDNVLGGAIGYILYIAFRPITTKILAIIAGKTTPREDEPSEEIL